ESKLLQDESRRIVKEEWIGNANNMYMLRMSSKERIIEKRKCKVLTENWRMVEDTNSLEKSPSKSFQYLEKQEKNRSSKSMKWLMKSRILSCLPRPVVKEEKRLCLIPTNMLEEMVRPETPVSKEKEHIAGDQLQSNRERDSNILVFYTDESLRSVEGGNKMEAGWVQVDSEGNLCLAKGMYRVEAWPSSTKPELVAIWLALLT
ncbi:12547_t:CDS:2, partial [Gigaspora rosea]